MGGVGGGLGGMGARVHMTGDGGEGDAIQARAFDLSQNVEREITQLLQNRRRR